MLIAVTASLLLVLVTVFLHYEVLRWANARLPDLYMQHRAKLLVVILGAFITHALEIALYGVTVFLLVRHFGIGTISGGAAESLTTSLYFSAETYTTLGFGDLTPMGPVRLLAGVEALNGLLMIGWSTSFTYLAMERFWGPVEHASTRQGLPCSRTALRPREKSLRLVR